MFPTSLQNISVTDAPVPAFLENATARGVLWQAAPGRFLLNLPGVASYLVEGGERITIEPAQGASSVAVTRFAGMTPLAALLYQRDALAFHAAAVANEHGAILLAGDSGSGKSTLLMALLQRGWTVLADELVVVTLDEAGRPVVHATSQEIALWPDTCTKFERDTDGFARADANRFLVPQPEGRATSPQPIRAIYWLGVQSKGEISCTGRAGTDLFRAIGMLLYNSHIAAALLDRTVYMGYCSAIIKAAPVTRVLRPQGSWSVAGLADLIEKELK